MGLGEVMGAMRLEWFAEIGLGVSIAGFAAVLLSLALARNRTVFERARYLPFDGDTATGGGREADGG